MNQRSIAIFTEGSPYTDLRGREALSELWKELCSKVTSIPPKVHIFGINKGQILALDEAQLRAGSREAVDVYIERMYQLHAFDVAIIAFDRIPPNQLIPYKCMRKEVNFVLEHFVRRKQLSEIWLDAAKQLLEHYAVHPKCSREPGRPPRCALDVLYMDPMFEGLLVADESTVLRALGRDRRPKDWPKFDPRNLHPDTNIMEHAVTFATPEIKRVIHGGMGDKKHDWALQIIRFAEPTARLFKHPIAQRLRTLLA